MLIEAGAKYPAPCQGTPHPSNTPKLSQEEGASDEDGGAGVGSPAVEYPTRRSYDLHPTGQSKQAQSTPPHAKEPRTQATHPSLPKNKAQAMKTAGLGSVRPQSKILSQARTSGAGNVDRSRSKVPRPMPRNPAPKQHT